MSSMGILIFFLELFSSTFWETVDFNITRHGWWIWMSWRTKWNCISKKSMLLSRWQCTLKSLPLFYFYILTQTNFYPNKRLVLDNIPVICISDVRKFTQKFYGLGLLPFLPSTFFLSVLWFSEWLGQPICVYFYVLFHSCLLYLEIVWQRAEKWAGKRETGTIECKHITFKWYIS